ncbi:uncharacterized protein PAC_11048 [Phialocephala subalpina]|uniref:Uncharacterized protein n=1 Tax=Phialocephala subalpina TaxID=576137 RepID=A0A1L7X811_9HELO|nr:uncharacterized protein PAC_11048 [Phialocephala subalpina]
MDWAMDREDAQLKANQHRRLRMLLLSSACSGLLLFMYVETLLDEDTSSNASEESVRLGKDDDVDMEETEEHPDTTMEGDVEVDGDTDDYCTSSTENFCKLFSDDSHNRHSWGLILYPTKNRGRYYCVGIFTSRAMEAGGTDLFRNVKYGTIDII